VKTVRTGVHRCLTCGREWRYTSVIGGLFKLFRGTLHVWWKHEGDETDLGPTAKAHV
jgi:hypothetical protein